MVHVFSKLGKYFMLDVESGSLFSLERPAFLLAKKLYGALSAEEEAEAAAVGSDAEREMLSEFCELRARGVLDAPELPTPKRARPAGIKSMCLNVSHMCNLACAYCFAGEGGYGGEKSNMSIITAEKAVDFLVDNSGNTKNLEIDFFGGEPMLNFPVVKHAVNYALSRAEKTGKIFKFTLTTNAVLLTPADIGYINETMDNVVLSIDGRESVHNLLRPKKSGGGSFSDALANSKKLTAARGDRDHYIRGTFTHKNLDFDRDVLALSERGFESLSIEPVVLPAAHPLAITRSDIPAIKEAYGRLLSEYVRRRGFNEKGAAGTDDSSAAEAETAGGGGPFSFFHFNYSIYGAPCLTKRVSGCGAGSSYIAVAANGDIYPCHQFVGMKDYLLGNVHSGFNSSAVPDELFCSDVTKKESCLKCFAKYHCSGGCHANAVNYSGSPLKPHEIMCELMRERVECAVAASAVLGEG